MSTKNNPVLYTAIFALTLAFAACGGGATGEQSTSAVSAESDLSVEAQIGPITSVELGDIDPDLVAAGEKAFTLRCTACHQLENTVIGPPLGGILEQRSPVYVMNMILNPTEMLAQHPVAKAQLEAFAVPMADLGVLEEDARAILEYLR